MIIQSSCLAKRLYLLLKLLAVIITYLHKTACALKTSLMAIHLANIYIRWRVNFQIGFQIQHISNPLTRNQLIKRTTVLSRQHNIQWVEQINISSFFVISINIKCVVTVWILKQN